MQHSPTSNRHKSYGSEDLKPTKFSKPNRKRVDPVVDQELQELRDRCYRLERQLEMMSDGWEAWLAHVQEIKTKYPKDP